MFQAVEISSCLYKLLGGYFRSVRGRDQEFSFASTQEDASDLSEDESNLDDNFEASGEVTEDETASAIQSATRTFK